MCLCVVFGHVNRGTNNKKNMEDQMRGVILWANAQDNKAVIWCEDHGNLAYYSQADHSGHLGNTIDAGDLIQFDVTDMANFRSASNLQRIVDDYAPDLPFNLQVVTQDKNGERHSADQQDNNSNVIQFSARA